MWFDATLGAESDKVSLKNVTFAASAKRKVGKPIDHNVIAIAATAAVAWSNENVVLVVLMFLYVVFSISSACTTATTAIRMGKPMMQNGLHTNLQYKYDTHTCCVMLG